MNNGRKYEFSWDLIGDLKEGRPNLGPTTRLEVYRLMQFCLRDVLEKAYGAEAADKIFYDAGYLAGRHFYDQLMGKTTDLNEFVKKLQTQLKELNIGILRVEEHDAKTGKIILTVSEDLDCSGLPELDYEICVYDEGFIAAILDKFTGSSYTVKEVDCWCTGDRTCRFLATTQKA
jgi:uncharacterized protein